jgi:hypothetical protein
MLIESIQDIGQRVDIESVPFQSESRTETEQKTIQVLNRRGNEQNALTANHAEGRSIKNHFNKCVAPCCLMSLVLVIAGLALGIFGSADDNIIVTVAASLFFFAGVGGSLLSFGRFLQAFQELQETELEIERIERGMEMNLLHESID